MDGEFVRVDTKKSSDEISQEPSKKKSQVVKVSKQKSSEKSSSKHSEFKDVSSKNHSKPYKHSNTTGYVNTRNVVYTSFNSKFN